jgi:hypothetical protein
LTIIKSVWGMNRGQKMETQHIKCESCCKIYIEHDKASKEKIYISKVVSLPYNVAHKITNGVIWRLLSLLENWEQ